MIENAEQRLEALSSEQPVTDDVEARWESERLVRDPGFEAAMLDVAAGIAVFSASSLPKSSDDAPAPQPVPGVFASRQLTGQQQQPEADDAPLLSRNPIGPVVADIAHSTPTLATRYRQRAALRAHHGASQVLREEVTPQHLLALIDAPAASSEADRPQPFDFLDEADRGLVARYYRAWTVHTAEGRRGRIISFATWDQSAV